MTHNTKKGFTMIEMIVVLGIFAVVSGIVLFNYGRFRSQTILTNMAYEVALSIREAQIYGVSVRKPDGNTPDFSQSYGIYFPGTQSNQYILFTDDGDNIFNGTSCTNITSPDACVTPYTLLGNIQIEDVAVENGGGACPSDNQPLNIVFKRPNPEPSIDGGSSIATRAQITVISPDGDRRYVVVANNGQISVVNEDICN